VAEIGEHRGVGRIGIVGHRVLVQLERLGPAHALERHAVAARVHDEPVQPGRELRFAAELLQARADLDQRLLRSVPRLLEIAYQLGGKAVDPGRIALDQCVERAPVAVGRLVDELRIGQLRVEDEPRKRRIGLGWERLGLGLQRLGG
jgi:hypothetical protein